MITLAITGHRGLPAHVERLVDDTLRAEVSRRADGMLAGVSCLADGPDSLFAHHVLDAGAN